MRRIFILLLCCCAARTAHSQLVLTDGLVMSTTPQTNIVVSVAGNVVNQSPYTFENTKLSLFLKGSNQQITGNMFVVGLSLVGGTTKTLSGDLTVKSTMELQEGVLVIGDGSNLLFTGNGIGVTASSAGVSYINGIFYQLGGNERFYPVGTSTGYAPVTFTDISENVEPVGVQAHDGIPPFIESDPTLTHLLSDFYWEVTISDASKINSQVRVLYPPSGLADNEQPVVVQDVAGVAENLGAVSSEEKISVLSARNVTSKVFGLAASTEVEVTIHELITPYGSFDVNDELVISNLEAFAFNKVMFLDRYGVKLKEWENYAKGTDKEYFKKLSPGNYIVIVEFGNSREQTQRKSQMVTILRSK